jgi:hypothetical protein
MCAVGTTTDDLTGKTVRNCIEKYDLQHDHWHNYQFANNPTVWHSYRDLNGVQQLIFGDTTGQCYQMQGTTTSDNGAAIESFIEFFIHLGAPESDKEWNYIWVMTSPGCQAKVQVAIVDTFNPNAQNWIDLKQAKDGVMEAKLSGLRGKFMLVKIYESSLDTRYRIYGATVDANIIDRR